jgi:DNA polymerase-3 subunit delta
LSTHILYGDSFLVPQAFRVLTADAGAADLLEANRHQLQGNQIKPAELFNLCNALPFMDPRRLVVVEGLLAAQERRSVRGRGRSKGTEPTKRTMGGWEELAKVVPQLPETTVLVFTDGPLSASNPLLRLLRPICQVQDLVAPSGEALARWVKGTTQRKAASISPAAIKRLTDLVGNDLWTLEQEIEKLSLYAFGRSIEERDVGELVPQVREANIFAAVDAMIEGRPGVALRLLHQLRQDGRDVSNIIAMVERQLRLLALTRDYMDKGVSQSDLGNRLGVSSQFVLRKTIEQARLLTQQDIARQYRRLLEADLAVKRGLMEPDLALELLVAEQAPRPRA